ALRQRLRTDRAGHRPAGAMGRTSRNGSLTSQGEVPQVSLSHPDMVPAVASTIILGLQQLNFWTGLAFSFCCPRHSGQRSGAFFNWRSRWILMEEAQYKLQRIRDELEYYLLKTPVADVALDDLDPFFERLQGVWTDTSERWLAYRRGGQTGSE